MNDLPYIIIYEWEPNTLGATRRTTALYITREYDALTKIAQLKQRVFTPYTEKPKNALDNRIYRVEVYHKLIEGGGFVPISVDVRTDHEETKTLTVG